MYLSVEDLYIIDKKISTFKGFKLLKEKISRVLFNNKIKRYQNIISVNSKTILIITKIENTIKKHICSPSLFIETDNE
tara:strand:+ start:85 stop:318 length:234 start_codon:yes stop_codon:yes gene_type:complete